MISIWEERAYKTKLPPKLEGKLKLKKYEEISEGRKENLHRLGRQ